MALVVRWCWKWQKNELITKTLIFRHIYTGRVVIFCVESVFNCPIMNSNYDFVSQTYFKIYICLPLLHQADP